MGWARTPLTRFSNTAEALWHAPRRILQVVTRKGQFGENAGRCLTGCGWGSRGHDATKNGGIPHKAGPTGAIGRWPELLRTPDNSTSWKETPHTEQSPGFYPAPDATLPTWDWLSWVLSKSQ